MFFIALPDEPMFGAIDKAIFRDSAIYLLDAFQTRQVLIYDMIDHSLRKVSNLGRGPNEYLGVSDIAINEYSSELVLHDSKSSNKLVFDLAGKFIRKEFFQPAFYFDCINGVYINQMGYKQSFSEDINFQLVTTNRDSILRKALPSLPLQRNDRISRGLSMNWRGEIMFLPSYSDSVYCVDSDSTYHVQYVLRQGKSLWKEAHRQLSDDETSRMIKEEGYTKVDNFWEGPGHIVFSVSKGHSSGRMLSSLHVYDKRTGKTYEFPNSDNSSPTPAGTVQSDIPFDYYMVSTMPIAICGDFFVGTFDPARYKLAWEEAIARGLKVEFVDPVFESLIKNANGNSNQALVFYRLK